MYSLKNVAYLFWTFIFLTVLLQLSVSDDLKFIGALLLSVAIVLIMPVHERFVRKKLIKTYIANGKTTRFILSTLGLSIFTSLILTTISYYIFKYFLVQTSASELITQIKSLFFGVLLFTSLISGVSYALELFKQKVASEKKHQELKNSVLELEIDHLRTQLSPHFTFNILNNLQFLIRKDKDEALELLSRYSKILRYYIYESQNKWIKLDDEITFINYYFELEKDKSEENLKVILDINIASENRLKIIPFLLSTFIENAFKHVSTTNSENYISVNISLKENNELNLLVVNSYEQSSLKEKKKGVGLIQAKKRLELSYPNKYELKIQQKKDEHQVDLKLKLTK